MKWWHVVDDTLRHREDGVEGDVVVEEDCHDLKSHGAQGRGVGPLRAVLHQDQQ